MIAAERARQIEKEGWSAGHDDGHGDGALRNAAEAYLKHLRTRWADWVWDRVRPPGMWPWGKKDFKPTEDPIRQLVKAGALIAAEIDRLLRDEAEIDQLVKAKKGKERA